MATFTGTVNTLAHDVSSNVSSLAHDMAPKVSSLAHDVSSRTSSLAHDMAPKVSSLAQDVASRAGDVAQVAGKHGRRWGRQAVDYGRQNLHQAGVMAAPKRSHKGRNALLIVVALVGAGVVWKLLFGRSDDGYESSADRTAAHGMPEAERLADRNHLDIA